MREFKDVLLELRKNNRLTQDELSNVLHITKQALSHYERGTRYPKKEIMEAIADYFNVDMNYLSGRSMITTALATPVANTPSSSPAAAPALTPDKEELLANYDKLNDEGKQEARKYVKLLGNSPEYTEDAEDTGNGNITA